MGDILGARNFSFPSEKWLSDGFVLVRHNAGGHPRDFWIGRHLGWESELGFPIQAHAFWSCANKMMSILLFLAEHPEDHGIRPHWLKVPTIAVLMVGIVKGEANPPQLEARGNYRAATAQDMGKVYSRNLAQQQIFVSKLDQGIPKGNKNGDSLPIDLPEFSEISQGDGTSINKEFRGKNHDDWDMSVLKDREHLDVL